MDVFKPRDCQLRAVNGVLGAIAQGHRRIVLTMPTGAGKSWVGQELCLHDIGRGALFLTNRRMLVDQFARRLRGAGLEFGVRAAGYDDERQLPLQISSVQTEASRVLRRKRRGDLCRAWPPHPCWIVVVDEGHLFAEGESQDVINAYLEAGAVVVYLTATPFGLGGVADVLIQAGTNSELRACGALVMARHYGVDEPDLSKIKVPAGEDIPEPTLRRLMMTPTIWGRVWDNWRRLNPDGRPTILFAPGISESVGFAEMFWKRGVSAAHIDGESVWVNGEWYKTSTEVRDEVVNGSRTGSLTVLCNRFVLREGIDAPWIAHGIFATVFGSVQSYLQAGGRLLRSHPDVPWATIQDHGGNYWRHGSLNADRTWTLGADAADFTRRRTERLREGLEPEPLRCPRCYEVVRSKAEGNVCPCGHEFRKGRPYPRQVVQLDGRLVEHFGRVVPPRERREEPDTGKKWENVYWRSRNCGRTFLQAEAFFFQQFGYWPPRTLAFMPREPDQWFLRVRDVERGALT